MNKFSIALAAAALIGSVGAAHAVDAKAKFNGNVAHSCTLVAGTDGTLVPNFDGDVLSSKLTGGAAATVTATTTAGPYKVSALAPVAFTLGSSTNTTFEASYSISGATTASNVAGATVTKVKRGTNNISVDLVATNSLDAFANGNYAAEVTVRCE